MVGKEWKGREGKERRGGRHEMTVKERKRTGRKGK